MMENLRLGRREIPNQKSQKVGVNGVAVLGVLKKES
jgi:hypothetical protein